jgi:hypothetical protein
VKIRTWKVGIAVLALGASPALAETSGWSYDNNVSGVAFASDCCEPACCADACCDVGCGAACAAGGLCSDGLLGETGLEALSLAALLGAEGTGLEIGGWTSGGYHDGNERLSFAPGDDLSFNSVPHHMNLQQQWFYLGRAADGSRGLDIGGRVDVMYGIDASEAQSYGNTTSIPGVPAVGARGFGTYDASLDHGSYGWAIPQSYVEVASGDLAVKLGHWFTPVGYEVIPDTGNFFRTHTLTHYNSEPFTHTGAMATYTGYELITLYSGWAFGWDTGYDQFHGGNVGIGGFAINLTDDIVFTYMNTIGNLGWRSGGSDDSYTHHLVMTVALTDNLNWIAQGDYLNVNSNSVLNPGFHEENLGMTNYLIYALNDVVSVGGRAEWWKSNAITGEANSFNDITGGVSVKLLSNVTWRAEHRYDWMPAEDNFRDDYNQSMFSTDIIVTY